MKDENEKNLWNKFQMSGRVSDYLEYTLRAHRNLGPSGEESRYTLRAHRNLGPSGEKLGFDSQNIYSGEEVIKSGDRYEDEGTGYNC